MTTINDRLQHDDENNTGYSCTPGVGTKNDIDNYLFSNTFLESIFNVPFLTALDKRFFPFNKKSAKGEE
jgi:hypothetical protein